MADLLSRLAGEPRSLTEELSGRPQHLKLFVSSKMSGGTYTVERQGCASAVDGTGIARAWYWERDTSAGPYCAEGVCLGQAASADGLILILGDELTQMTRREYEVAREREIPTFVFIDERLALNVEAEEFVRAERAGPAVTKNFTNLSELKTHVVDAIHTFGVQSWRRASHSKWSAGRGRSAGAP
jgi:hypothetical protein